MKLNLFNNINLLNILIRSLIYQLLNSNFAQFRNKYIKKENKIKLN